MANSTLTTVLFYLTVFLTGAIVLILEVLAVRLLSPFFGTSIYVLSGVLTVILAALSLGYFFGGRIADRFPFPQPLYLIIATSGFILLGLYILTTSILSQDADLLPLTYGPLVFAAAFFFLPAFLLGMDSPYVIRLLSRSNDSSEATGRLAGTTFFWSTIGSICGSLSSGFFFIPFLGVEKTIILSALALSLLALAAIIILNRRSVSDQSRLAFWFRLPVFLILSSVTFLLAFQIYRQDIELTRALPNAELLYETDGYYGHIAIFEYQDYIKNSKVRILKREVNSESAIFVDSYDHVFDYTKFADLYPVLRSASTTNFLMLGGGAYTIPRILEHNDPNLLIDVVELEPKLYPLAKEYFDLPESPRITNYQMDARAYLESTDQLYDVIFVDVFSSGLFTPPHLSTQEFFKLMQTRLREDGLLVINFIGSRDNPGQNLSDSFYITVASVFPNLRTFSVHQNQPGVRQNIIYLAKNSAGEFSLNDASIETKDGRTVPLSDIEIKMNLTDPEAQLVFTDDQVPAEYLLAKQLWFDSQK